MAHLIATLLTAAGAALLFGSWRKRLRPGWAWNTAGWLAITGAFTVWSRAMGPEYGPAVAILVLPLAAWVIVGFNRRVREPRSERIQPASVSLPPLAAVLRHLGRFLLTVPVAAVASILLALVLAWALPWTDAGRLALVILAVPVIWGLFAWWITADRRAWRPGMVVAVTAVLCGLILYT